jgi:hypothetical protein
LPRNPRAVFLHIRSLEGLAGRIKVQIVAYSVKEQAICAAVLR